MTSVAPALAGAASWWPSAAMEMAARAYRAGDLKGAEAGCLAVIAHDSGHFEALTLLGAIASDRANLPDAALYYGRAAKAWPDAAGAQFRLGNVLAERERYETATAAYRKALEVEPANTDALNMLGNALAAQRRYEEAIGCYERALALRPSYPPLLYNFGKRLFECGRFEEAAANFRAALANAGPNAPPERVADVYTELSRTLMQLGRPLEALEVLRAMRVRNCAPGRAEWHESLVLLALGRYDEGWQKFEFCYSPGGRKLPHAQARPLELPEIGGKRVLVWADQGFGDTIQFARYLPLLLSSGAAVSVIVHPELRSLLAEIDGLTEVVAGGDAEPPHDLVTLFTSLPRAFRTEVATIPADVPYLKPPASRLEAWRERLGPAQKPRIAVCYRGSQEYPERSIPLAALEALLSLSNVEFHLVQIDIPPADRTWLDAHPSISLYDSDLTDFAETASLLAQMDLVISIDTAVAHLAGALAKPLWVLLPFSADWRWLLDRDDSPWYPTARLFRQPKPGDWEAVVASVSGALNTHTFPGFPAPLTSNHGSDLS